jgi:hypothetical protein
MAARNLKKMRERTGLTVRETARLIEMPTSTYASYEDKFKKPYLPVDLVKSLEPHFVGRGVGVDEVYALAGVGKGMIPEADPEGFREGPSKFTHAARSGFVDLNGAEFATIPRYDAGLSAGPGSIIDADSEPIGFHLIEAQWLRSVTQTAPSRLAVLRVAGDSMEDTLADGDWVLVDRGQTRAAQEGIYALQIDDTTWVKRLSLNLRERLIRVISDNPRYPVQELPADDLTVIGRIVWIVARKV